MMSTTSLSSSMNTESRIRMVAILCAVVWSAIICGLHAAYYQENREVTNEIVRSFGLVGPPEALIHKTMDYELVEVAVIHSIIWLAGVGLIYFGSRKILRITRSLSDERNQYVESEQRFRSMADTTPAMIWMTDENKAFTYVNAVWCDVTGRRHDDLIGDGWLKDIHPDDVTACTKTYAECFDARLAMALEFRVRRYDGEYRWLVVNGVPRWLHDTEFLGYIGSCVDITERKQSEIALNDSKEHYRAIVEAFDGKLYICSQDYKIEFMNDRLIARTGRNAVGESCFKALHNRDDICPWCVNEQVFRGETVRWEVRSPKDDRWYYVVNTPIHNRDGTVSKQAMIRDITDQKRAEEERQQLERQFHQAQKMESLGVLAGGIAHDFNNILTVILGHCYLATQTDCTAEQCTSYFSQIEAAANRAADLCRQMLTYAGKNHPVQTPVHLDRLVDEVVNMLRVAIQKNISIELALEPDIPALQGDSGQLQQIVMNLIINAAEAIDQVPGTIRIAVATRPIMADQAEVDAFGVPLVPGRYICLEVADSGCGMDDETRKRIFEPFFTTKFTGRGLGMSAICGIVKSHGAFLTLTSFPGAGTTFSVYFPVPDATTVDLVEPESAELPQNAVQGKVVLLVEDNDRLREMGAALLEAQGFTTLSACHGREAVEICTESGERIDLILMDLTMPVMGGIEAYHEIRKLAPEVPVIFCSGYSADSVKTVLADDRHADFVNKPYLPDQLLGMMVRMMQGGASETGGAAAPPVSSS